jgi:hypothetical protein
MLSSTIVKGTLLLVLGTGILTAGIAQAAHAASQDDADIAAKIENAMSAAPSSVSANATILDNALDDAGKFVVLREGSSEWACFPDVPSTPRNDPMCGDATWLDWSYAYAAGEDPTVTAPGFAYMLQGGSDASNSDPFATEPAAGEDWVISAPHVMLLLPDKLDPAVYSTDHDAGGPYVMWAGTPYEHVMMPVVDAEHPM